MGQTGAAHSPVRFSVATFNLRGVSDRWQERRPVLQQCLKEVDADVLCFQEVLTGEYGQERKLLGPEYHVVPCKAALFNLAAQGGAPSWYANSVARALHVPPLRRLMVQLPAAVESVRESLNLGGAFFRTLRDLTLAPFFGNSVACRLAEAHEIRHGTLVLGDWRAAQRIEFSLGGGGGGSGSGRGSGAGAAAGSAPAAAPPPLKVWVVNTHLDHDHTDTRQRQAAAVCRWMDGARADGAAAVILCGDMNGPPQEGFHQFLERDGYASAYRERHGREPDGTWPTGIVAPLMDRGAFECLDYVYFWAAEGYTVKVLDAELHGNQPAAHDKTLYPSDHAALKVTLEIAQAH